MRAVSFKPVEHRPGTSKRLDGRWEDMNLETTVENLISKGFSNHLHPLADFGRMGFVYVAGETADLIFAGTRPLRSTGYWRNSMNLPVRSKKLLNLEADLPLTPEDFHAMSAPHPKEDQDLADYLIFLETIGAFNTKKTEVKIYQDEFSLR